MYSFSTTSTDGFVTGLHKKIKIELIDDTNNQFVGGINHRFDKIIELIKSEYKFNLHSDKEKMHWSIDNLIVPYCYYGFKNEITYQKKYCEFNLLPKEKYEYIKRQFEVSELDQEYYLEFIFKLQINKPNGYEQKLLGNYKILCT